MKRNSEKNEGENNPDDGLDRQQALLGRDNADFNLQIDGNNDEMSIGSCDQTEDSEESHEIPFVTVWNLIQLVYPILSHVFDFASDVRLTVDYFANQKTGHGSLTLAFTMLQAITAAWISSIMHHPKLVDASAENENDNDNGKGNWFTRTTKSVAQYLAILIFQMAMPMCHLRNLIFTWKLRRSQLKGDVTRLRCYHRKTLEEERDLAVLQVIQCFLHSVPQLVLQLVILLDQDTPINDPLWAKIISGTFALFGLGSAMKKYHCASRLAQSETSKVSEIGGVFLFVWHLNTIAARIFIIGIAASNWLLYTVIACVVNWMGWTAWIYVKENGFAVLRRREAGLSDDSPTVTKRIHNFILSGIVATVYTFTFINVGKGCSFIRNSVYHVLCLLQNGAVVVFWSIFCDTTVGTIWLSKDLLILSVVLFFIGIAAMAIYYTFFHPSRRNSVVLYLPCVDNGLLPK